MAEHQNKPFLTQGFSLSQYIDWKSLAILSRSPRALLVRSISFNRVSTIDRPLGHPLLLRFMRPATSITFRQYERVILMFHGRERETFVRTEFARNESETRKAGHKGIYRAWKKIMPSASASYEMHHIRKDHDIRHQSHSVWAESLRSYITYQFRCANLMRTQTHVFKKRNSINTTDTGVDGRSKKDAGYVHRHRLSYNTQVKGED